MKISDVAALSRKLKAEEAQKEEKRLIEKHGEEGLKKIRDAEKKAAEVTTHLLDLNVNSFKKFINHVTP